MIRSTATAGVRSTRSGTPARFPARPLAPPNPAAAANRSRGAGTRPANPASEPRCAESTKCLPALCGRWPVAAHPAGVGGASVAEAESFPLRVGQQPTVSWHRPSPWRCASFLPPWGETNYGVFNTLYPVLQLLQAEPPGASAFEACLPRVEGYDEGLPPPCCASSAPVREWSHALLPASQAKRFRCFRACSTACRCDALSVEASHDTSPILHAKKFLRLSASRTCCFSSGVRLD